MRVPCEVAYITLENDDGVEVESVAVTCTECDHEVVSYGTSDRSVRRCLALMREECPEGAENYYVAEEDP